MPVCTYTCMYSQTHLTAVYLLFLSSLSLLSLPPLSPFRIRRSPLERVKARGKLRESVGSPDENARGVVPPGPEEEADGDSRGPVSEPISIKGTVYTAAAYLQ